MGGWEGDLNNFDPAQNFQRPFLRHAFFVQKNLTFFKTLNSFNFSQFCLHTDNLQPVSIILFL